MHVSGFNLNSEIGINHRLRRFHRFNDPDAGRILECPHRRVASSQCFSAVLICAHPRNLWFLIRNLGLTGALCVWRGAACSSFAARRRWRLSRLANRYGETCGPFGRRLCQQRPSFWSLQTRNVLWSDLFSNDSKVFQSMLPEHHGDGDIACVTAASNQNSASAPAIVPSVECMPM